MATPSLTLQGSIPQIQNSGSTQTIIPAPVSFNQSVNPSTVSPSLNLKVDPTSTFDPETQQKYASVLQQGVPQDQAIQAATTYQQNKDKNNPKSTDVGGIKGLLTNSDSIFNTTNIGSTLGMFGADALGVLLAPETGGLSLLPALALSSAASAAGGTIGEGVRQLAGGNDIDYGKAAETSAISGAGGKLLGEGTKWLAGGASKLLSEKAENLALGSLGITKGQSGAFGVQTGSKLGDFLTKTGLLGKTADDVTALKATTQDAYDAIARKSGIQVPVSDLTENIQKQIQPLSAGVSSDSKAAAQAIQDEYEQALKGLGVDINDPNATVDIGKLTDAKSEYQGQVNWKNPDHINTVKGSLAKAFLDTVNTAAGGLTDSEGNTLAQLGKKLQGLNLVDQWAQKAANTTGTQKTPWTLGNILRGAGGTIVGAGVGGPLGGAVGTGLGIASDVIANHPKVIAATSKLFQGGADIIPKVVNSPLTAAVGDAGSQILGHTIANSGNQSSMPSTPDLSSSSSESTVPSTPPSNLGEDQATQGIRAIQSGKPLTQNQYQALMEKDLVSTGGRFQDKITAAYNAGNPTAVQGLGVASGALNTLNDLYSTAGGAKGTIAGGIESALGSTGLTAKSTQAYNQQKLALGQEIISQIYGSSGTSSDRDQVLSLIPDVSDPPQVASSKMATLRALIQQRVNAMNSSTPSSVLQSTSPSLNLQQ